MAHFKLIPTIIYSIAFPIGLFLFLNFHTFSPNKKISLQNNSHWEIYYGEVNSIHSYIQIDTNFILNTTEFIFIDKDNNGYCNLDTSTISKADSLVPIKLALIKQLKGANSDFIRIKKTPIDSSSFYISLINSTRSADVYKLEKNKQHYYLLKEFAIYHKDTLTVQGTGRDNRATKTRSFKLYKTKS